MVGLVPHQVSGTWWGWCHTRWVGHGRASATPGGWVMVGLVPHQVGGAGWGTSKRQHAVEVNCRVDVELELGLGL